MILKDSLLIVRLTAFSVLLLTACNSNSNSADNFTGLKAKVLVGSGLGDFYN